MIMNDKKIEEQIKTLQGSINTLSGEVKKIQEGIQYIALNEDNRQKNGAETFNVDNDSPFTVKEFNSFGEIRRATMIIFFNSIRVSKGYLEKYFNNFDEETKKALLQNTLNSILQSTKNDEPQP